LTLLYASTFTKALSRLTAAEQKQVKITAFDLAQDEVSHGLQLHRVDASPGFWTARVSQDIRIVLHKDGEQTLLAWVDHHDDAYRWAERRRLIPHERTGSMQLVEIVERVEEQLVYTETIADAQPAPVAVNRPFATLSDDELLDVGVPREWLEIVRGADYASVDGLFGSLPDEAAEALLDYVTGGSLADHIPAPVAIGSDPFVHPDAMRRFRVVEDVEELRAALDAPFDQWAVFLHPNQRAMVTRDWNGPARVSGSAGTGKTIVAVHRAVELAASIGARVMLTTFSTTLADNLAKKVKLLTEALQDRRNRLAVGSIDSAALDLYSVNFSSPTIATDEQIKSAVLAALETVRGASHTAAFLIEEWTELIDAWSVQNAEEYKSVPRIGRRTRLGPNQRDTAWAVFDFVRQRLRAEGLLTLADVYGELTHWIESCGKFPFTHVVVDEAQDLSVAQAKFLAAVGRAGRANTLFFTGDLGQRIFSLPFSWARLGIDVRGRAQVLKVCYRTSHQIRHAADRLLSSQVLDQDGIEETRLGTVSVFDGPEPVLSLLKDKQEERSVVAAWLKQRAAENIPESEIAILIRSEAQMQRAQAAANEADISPAILTMHNAKGLEFRAVAVIALDEDVLPDPERLAGVGDVGDLEALQDTERHLLYVAATRARDHLLLSGIRPGSEFLDDLLSER
jgi:UvrD-like helicase C-terminal domain/AAA domain